MKDNIIKLKFKIKFKLLYYYIQMFGWIIIFKKDIHIH